MSEADLKAEARLLMLEQFVCNLYSLRFSATDDPLGAAKAFAKQAETFREATVPGVDPVAADMFLDELALAATNLAEQIIEQLEASQN